MKNLNSIFDTEYKDVHFIGSNKYIITKIKCWPVFKQDPFFYSATAIKYSWHLFIWMNKISFKD